MEQAQRDGRRRPGGHGAVDWGAAGASGGLAFCPRCGQRVVDGRCVAHGAPNPTGVTDPVAEAAATQAVPTTVTPFVVPDTLPVTTGDVARRRRWPLVTGAVAAAVTLTGAVTVGELRSDTARLKIAKAAAERRVEEQAARLGAAEAGINGLSRRVSEIEGALAAAPDTSEVAGRVQRSVFTVETDDGDGSAWAVSADQVVTNFHVVAEGWVNDRRSVTIRQDDHSWPATVVEVSPAEDLAVIAVSGRTFSPLERATVRPAVGDAILVVGSPLGLGGTVASGIVSSFRTEDGTEYLQFSAPVSPGSSGGPVVDSAGRVVGVAVAKLAGGGAEGLSFAIPIDRACNALEAC